MKILFLSHSFYPAIGGIETVSETLAQAFFDAGHDVHLLTWTKNTGEKRFSFPVIRQPAIIQLFREHMWAELVFENNVSTKLSWPSLITGRHTVIALHTWISRMNGSISIRDYLKVKKLQYASRVVACSDAIRKRTFPKATVISNPYNNELFKLENNGERTRDFVFLGRLVSDKGVDLAIESFASFFNIVSSHKGACNPTLTIIGDGIEKKSLEKIVAHRKIEKQVVFMGVLAGERLVRCLNDHQFILIPSRWEEPFGLVALEGMACGCIPIASDGGGLSEAIGDAGILFRKNDVDELVQKMTIVYNNNDQIQELRKKAASHLAAHTVGHIASQYIKLIEEVANKAT